MEPSLHAVTAAPGGVPWLANVNVAAIVDRVGTPSYLYSAPTIRQRLLALKDSFRASAVEVAIRYAVKANSNLALLGMLGKLGVGADIVSAGELRRCLAAGINADLVVFSGVGKTVDEMREALHAGVGRFNVESTSELLELQRLAAEQGVEPAIALRVNPDVDALTHAKIATGKSQNKFGMSFEDARRCFARVDELPNLRIDGLHMHIGSQITRIEPFERAFAALAGFADEVQQNGTRIASIDVGGGLGISYRESELCLSPDTYATALARAFRGFRGRLLVEPGRWLMAPAGVLLTRVVRIKQNQDRTFVILDAGMNDLLRPALYDAWHDIAPLHPARGAPYAVDIVGPVCETGDTFAVQRLLPPCRPGDLVVIRDVGAYGASMASHYNSRPLPAEVMIDDGRWASIRERTDFPHMIAGENPNLKWEST